MAADGTRATNSQSLEKATVSDFSAGGTLAPEQFNDFMVDVQESGRILPDVQQFTPSAPSGDIPRMDMASRQLVAATEATENNTDATFQQPDVPFSTTKVTLSHEFSWEAVNETIDDAEGTIRRMFAQRFGSDLEILASVGDTSGSGFTALEDGWLTRADTRKGSVDYDHASAGIDKTVFQELQTAMPEKFKAEGDNMVFLTSWAQRDAYKDYLTDRSTAAGDAMLMTGQEPTPYGYDIRCPLGWPDDRVMMTSLDNLGYVVQDDVRTRETRSSERNVRGDVELIMAMFAKLDYVVLDEEGITTAQNVAAP